MYDPTNLYEELNRKTMEALQRVVYQYSQGELSKEAYRAAVTAIWNVTAGLTKGEISELVDESLNALGEVTTKRYRIWYSKGVAAVAVWTAETCETEVTVYSQNGKHKLVKKSGSAQKIFDAMTAKFGEPICRSES